MLVFRVRRKGVGTVFEDLDELARGLAENDVSRRQALRWVGYSVLGATLSSMGFADGAEALSRRKRRRCRRQGGTVCQTPSGKKCVFTQTDPNNCGECGHVCEDDGNPCTSTVCLSGFCGNNNLPVGTPCATGMICNQDGVCVPE
jgi:hypothetical protein